MKQCFVKTEKEKQAALTRLPPTRLRIEASGIWRLHRLKLCNLYSTILMRVGSNIESEKTPE